MAPPPHACWSRWRRRALALTILTLLPSGLGAQSERPTFDERLEVSEIVLDALVVDDEGHPVPGLDVEDLVVLEDRQPVELTSVRYYRTTYEESADRIDQPAVDLPVSRYFIVFVHDARFQQAQPLSSLPTLLRQQRRAGLALEDWFADGLSPSDWVAVAGFGRDGLRVVQDFTQDRDALVAAAEVATNGGLAALPPRTKPPRSKSSATRTPSSLSLVQQLDAVREPSRRRGARRGTVETALQRVASATSTIVGRKDLILIGPGLGAPSRRKGAPDPFPDLAEALLEGNVVLSVLDLGGPRPRGSEAAVARGSGGQFLTGGAMTHHLERLARETRGYYVLSYRTTVAEDARGWRRIDVYARNRDLTVRTRHGYRVGAP